MSQTSPTHEYFIPQPNFYRHRRVGPIWEGVPVLVDLLVPHPIPTDSGIGPSDPDRSGPVVFPGSDLDHPGPRTPVRSPTTTVS